MNNFLFSRPKLRALAYGPRHLKDFLWQGNFTTPFRLVVDITNRCNLNCKTCFWQKEKRETELSDEHWEKVINRVLKKYPSILLAFWFGGEPMLRLGLIKKLARRFPFNELVTNGTLPLETVEGVNYFVSIDGTREYHEQQRGKNYDRIKRNVSRAENKNISLIYVISALNRHNIEDFCAEWSKEKNVSRILFSFYNKDLSFKNDPLWLDLKSQDKILKEIMRFGAKYPKVAEAARQLKYLCSSQRKKAIRYCWQTRKNGAIFLDSTGRIKYSAYARKKGFKVSCESRSTDCSSCGSICLGHYSYLGSNRFEHFKSAFSRHLLKI